jgi:hypothetical protein
MLCSKDTQNLSKILEIVKNIPRINLVNNLKKAPGWSYHGPFRKIENKLGPGRYGDPIFIVEREDFNVVKEWFHYPIIPRYDIHGFLPSRHESMVMICIKILGDVKLPIESYEWSSDNGIHKIVLTSMDEDTTEGKGENQLLAAYDLYREVYLTENFMKIPALMNMTGVVDVNTDWNGEPTIIFETFPYDLIMKYKDFFSYNPFGQCVGSIKLIEDDFHIVTERLYIPRLSEKGALMGASQKGRLIQGPLRPASKKRKATHVGGLITRLK